MVAETGQLRYRSILTLLIMSALLLVARLIYMFLADVHRFPITTVQVTASYQHISRKQLETVLMSYLNSSFFALSVGRLQADLLALNWSKIVSVERVWPNTLKITLIEKQPVALWNGRFLTSDGDLYKLDQEQLINNLPILTGPEQQQKDVLQTYQKMSKLLSMYGLQAASLQLRDNQAWDLSLTNGVLLNLGKQDLERRLVRFCRAYPVITADKPEQQLASIDLRYARGMAVQWKLHMGK